MSSGRLLAVVASSSRSLPGLPGGTSGAAPAARGLPGGVGGPEPASDEPSRIRWSGKRRGRARGGAKKLMSKAVPAAVGCTSSTDVITAGEGEDAGHPYHAGEGRNQEASGPTPLR